MTDLRSIPLFDGVPEAELHALAQCTVTRSYPKQAIIVSEGDDTDSLYLILAGRVKVYLSDEAGKELILAIKGPGQYFGEMVLDSQPRSASVMTLEPSQFAILSRAVSQREQGMSIGLRTTANRLATMMVPAVMGYFVEVTSIETSFVILGAVMIGLCGVLALVIRRIPGFST